VRLAAKAFKYTRSIFDVSFPILPAELQLLQGMVEWNPGNVEWNPGPLSREVCEGSDFIPGVSAERALSEDEPLAARAPSCRTTTTFPLAQQHPPASQTAGKKRRRKESGAPKPRGGANGRKGTPGRKGGTSILDGISTASAQGQSGGQGTRSGGPQAEQQSQPDQAEAGLSSPTELDEEELLKQQIAESCWNAAINKVGRLSDKRTKEYERGLKTYKVNLLTVIYP
jgi:hypothetical protein